MGVYIKGMEMPEEGCKDCVFVDRKWHGDICPLLKREVSGNVERGGFQTDCPLIEIPQHGDLVDRDKLKKRFCVHCDDYKKCQEPCFDIKLIDSVNAIIPTEKEET